MRSLSNRSRPLLHWAQRVMEREPWSSILGVSAVLVRVVLCAQPQSLLSTLSKSARDEGRVVERKWDPTPSGPRPSAWPCPGFRFGNIPDGRRHDSGQKRGEPSLTRAHERRRSTPWCLADLSADPYQTSTCILLFGLGRGLYSPFDQSCVGTATQPPGSAGSTCDISFSLNHPVD